MAFFRIALFSDDPLYSDSVAAVLAAESDFGLVTRETAPASFTASHAASVDVVLLDARVEAALGACGRSGPSVPVILLQAPSGASWVRQALCQGARGVLPRTASANELCGAIRAVAGGSIWAPRRIIASCMKDLVEASRSHPPSPLASGRDANLSIRERQVFHCAAAGLGNKEIADRLAIGEATVKAHLTHVFQKLGVRGRAELAALYHSVHAPLSRWSYDNSRIASPPPPLRIRPLAN